MVGAINLFKIIRSGTLWYDSCTSNSWIESYDKLNEVIALRYPGLAVQWPASDLLLSVITKKFFNSGGQNYGCGKCPEVVNFCYECNTKECNSKHNFDNAFKCYESNGKLSSKIGIGCNSNKCYLASNVKGKFIGTCVVYPPPLYNKLRVLSSLYFPIKGKGLRGTQK